MSMPEGREQDERGPRARATRNSADPEQPTSVAKLLIVGAATGAGTIAFYRLGHPLPATLLLVLTGFIGSLAQMSVLRRRD